MTETLSNTLSTLRSGLTGACLLMVCLFAGSASANCQTFLAPYFAWVPGGTHAVGYTYASMQGNGIASYASTNWTTAGALLKNSSGYLDSRINQWHGVNVLYSDRQGTNSQPFSTSTPDNNDLVVSPTGDVWIVSNTWNATVQLTGVVCENNMLRGWGTAVGSYSYPALYLIQFERVSDIG
ncbi:hypothetical protein JY651_01235 [Pyxidicoccus parkwayensis]|uniref:Uncharacterized protein n=1 Tax=Pyxidicoccus parkwayensis TaxID=2813578 RepID=A0ABX7NXN7_9BACT|nr:hypothetical protein [Pyxidicoccus parkwaysis]QSQ23639.1 hypothetical protein JY651_01235 [Pyxidicoccus parkwaysis]